MLCREGIFSGQVNGNYCGELHCYRAMYWLVNCGEGLSPGNDLVKGMLGFGGKESHAVERRGSSGCSSSPGRSGVIIAELIFWSTGTILKTWMSIYSL